MVYKRKFMIIKGKLTNIKKAMATAYASSPYLTEKQKDKYIKQLFGIKRFIKVIKVKKKR